MAKINNRRLKYKISYWSIGRMRRRWFCQRRKDHQKVF